MNAKPNDPPVILLLGHQGQVGWELRRTLAPLGRVRSVDYPEINLAGSDSIRGWVAKVRPQVIVNAAAYTAVDKAEAETDLAMKINGEAPGILAEEAKKLGALLVHYSTDYVYDGLKNSPYVEEDAPHPLSSYGRSKWAGDVAVGQVDGAHLIFRLCWVYGTRGHNFMLTMQRLARERETLRVVRDQVGCPTWSRLIAETTAQAVGRVLSHPRGQGAEGRGQGAEGRGQRAEGRGQRAEGRGQRAGGRGQRAEGRGQRAEGRGQRAEGRLRLSSIPPLGPLSSGRLRLDKLAWLCPGDRGRNALGRTKVPESGSD